jgi:hypothetical protein
MQLIPGKLEAVSTESTSAGKAATQRAIELLTKSTAGATTGNAQELPVKNANAISPEELSAVSTTSKSKPSQSDTSEASVEAAAVSSEAAPASAEASPNEAPKPPEEPLSSQYAQLARKEKAIRAKAQEVKAKEAELAAREAALTAKTDPKPAEGPTLKDRASKDPLGVMQELGISYEQLTELLLNQDPNQARYQADMEALKAEIKALREENKSTREADQQQQYKNAVNQIRTEVSQLVKSDEAFETIRETGSVDDVVELIEATFKEEGRILPIEEAAQLVEDHLLEEALKLTRLKKIQAKLNVAKPAPAVKQPEVKAAPTAKTLTNQMSTTKPLTAVQRAMLAFEGKLPK